MNEILHRLTEIACVALVLWVLLAMWRRPRWERRSIREEVEVRGAEVVSITALPRRGWLGSRDPAAYAVQYRKQGGEVVTARCTFSARGRWFWSGENASAWGTFPGANAAPPPL